MHPKARRIALRVQHPPSVYLEYEHLQTGSRRLRVVRYSHQATSHSIASAQHKVCTQQHAVPPAAESAGNILLGLQVKLTRVCADLDRLTDKVSTCPQTVIPAKA
jgi:hypothetical protein